MCDHTLKPHPQTLYLSVHVMLELCQRWSFAGSIPEGLEGVESPLLLGIGP